MSQLKAKQIKLAAAGDLLIGGNGGTGTSLSATGNDFKVLKVIDGAPEWALNDTIESANGKNVVFAEDGVGVVVVVENAAGTSPIQLVKFKNSGTADENLEISAAAGAMTIAAKGTTPDVDIVLAPQGGGEVIIGNAGAAAIQADAGEDLALLGGSGAGNLLLFGGGTGKVYYGPDSTDPDLEVATVGSVSAAVSSATVYQTRRQFAGNATFTIDNGAIWQSIDVHINGLVIDRAFTSFSEATNAVSVDTGALGYTLDAQDFVVITYETTVNPNF